MAARWTAPPNGSWGSLSCPECNGGGPIRAEAHCPFGPSPRPDRPHRADARTDRTHRRDAGGWPSRAGLSGRPVVRHFGATRWCVDGVVRVGPVAHGRLLRQPTGDGPQAARPAEGVQGAGRTAFAIEMTDRHIPPMGADPLRTGLPTRSGARWPPVWRVRCGVRPASAAGAAVFTLLPAVLLAVFGRWTGGPVGRSRDRRFAVVRPARVPQTACRRSGGRAPFGCLVGSSAPRSHVRNMTAPAAGGSDGRSDNGRGRRPRGVTPYGAVTSRVSFDCHGHQVEPGRSAPPTSGRWSLT